MRAALAALAGLGLALAALTWWALESGGVAVVETRRPDGGARTTHVWFVEDEGGPWLEAGAPENAWFTDVQREPLLRFSAEGISGRYRARPVPEPARRDALRAQLRAKYGLRDAWVGLFVDPGRSVPVRLEPVAP
jgi:hypothetical protein